MKPYRAPLVIALGCQLAAGGVVFAGAEALEWAVAGAVAGAVEFRPPLAAMLVLHGGAAALLGWRFGLAWWWAPIQLVAPAALALALGLAWAARLPAWIFLAAFVLLLGLFWNSAGDRVPLYLSNRKTRAALAGLLPDRPDLAVADLGSGLGGVGAELARRRPAARVDAIESAPLPFALGWLGHRLAGPANLAPIYGDLWSADLGAYDVVYCFLSPAPMPALYAKARAEMRPGSLLISNSFAVPDAPADRVVEVGDRRGTRLHVWRM